MANYEDLLGDFSLIADVDLTANQYKFVTVASTAGNVKAGTGGSNPLPLGVQQNSPSAGEAVRIRAAGITKLVGGTDSSSPMTYGRVFTASGAKASPTTCETGNVALGIWLDATIAVSSSNIGKAYITFAGLGGCAVSAS